MIVKSDMKKYVLYKSVAESSYSFFEENDETNMKLLPSDAELTWSVIASSWEEAQAKKHEHLGWEPYKPMS